MNETRSAITTRQLRKDIAGMIFPLIVENILQMLAGMVSMAMIGRVSNIAVSAQGVSNLLVGIIWSLLKGISIGTTVLVARAYGEGDEERVSMIAWHSLLLSLSMSAVLLVLVRHFATQLLSIFNPDPIIMENATMFLRIVAFGFPATAIILTVTGTLQGRGNTRTPMIVASIMNIVNVLVSAPLIFGYLGFRPLGLRGAAIGLVIAQVSGALCGLHVLFRRGSFLRVALMELEMPFEWKLWGELLRVGIPSGMETIFWQTASIILSRVILSFGPVAFSANQLGLQAETLSEMPAIGFGVAATAFTGQALGAQDKELAERSIRELKKGALLVISFGTCILLFFPRQAMSLLTDDPEVIALGAIYLRMMGFIQIPQNLQRVYAGALKGAGHTRIPMRIAGIGLWGIRIPLALILSQFFNAGIVAIWTVVCIDQTSRFLLSLYYYRKMKLWD